MDDIRSMLIEVHGFTGGVLLDGFEVDGFGGAEGGLRERGGRDDVDALGEDTEGCYWVGL